VQSWIGLRSDALPEDFASLQTFESLHILTSIHFSKRGTFKKTSQLSKIFVGVRFITHFVAGRRSIREVMSANIASTSGEPETAISIEKVPEKFLEPAAAAVTLETPPDGGENGLASVPSEAPYSIFSKDTKIFIVFMACIAGLISPLAATMYYPALNPLAAALHVSNSKITLSITTYMVTLISKMTVE